MTEKLMGRGHLRQNHHGSPFVEELGTARELVRQARSRDVVLTGHRVCSRALIETALDEEMSERLGYDKYETVWS